MRPPQKTRRIRTMRKLLAAVALAALAGSAPAGPKEVQVTVTDMGFQPNAITIKKGQAAVLVMTRKSDQTCATEAIFTETGRKYDLPRNQPARAHRPDRGEPGHGALFLRHEHGARDGRDRVSRPTG